MKLLYYLPVVALFLFTSCEKETQTPEPEPVPAPTPTPDNIAPVINLTGNTDHTITLNTAYVEPGVIATDNVDGNISSAVTVTGTINKDLVGEYRLYYNVKDAAGNKAVQVTRYVHVVNSSDELVGVYLTTPNCGATPTGPGSSTLSASATVNNDISFNIPGNVSGIIPVIKVSGNALSIPLNTSATGTILGNGTIATDKKSFVLTYTAISSNSSLGTRECTTTFNKQ
jgi:hypothetical protein